LNRTRRLSPVWLLVALAPLVRADDTTSPVKKPAASATSPASKPAAAPVAKPAAPSADDEFLEFLGSVDEETDGEWIDYLSKTDISKASKAKTGTK
jgi:cell division septation protein DedD